MRSDWIEQRTAGAPELLRGRVGEYLDVTGATDDPAGLAAAGESALGAAIAAGADRAGALDLLAADALITLAMLAAAERDPARLGSSAQTIREAATRAR